MGNASSNYNSGLNSVDIDLDFDIDPQKGQDEIRSFGYFFNAKGECRSIKDNERVGKFSSQTKYEEFGAALERYVFFLLKDQYHMTENIIKSTKESNDGARGNDQKKEEQTKDEQKKDEKTKRKRKDYSKIDTDKIAKSRIYLSPNYAQKETLLLLIPGSGAVRAGQWARSICINDNLAAGCMYPFISEAYKRDWGVVLFDPNGRTESGRIFSDDHVLHVYDTYVEQPYLSKSDCKIKNVLIVCHSAGGMATTRLLNDKSKYLLPRIRGVAGTDTFFGRAQNKAIEKVYKTRIVNWVASSQPLGTILSNSVPKRVSSGHSKHEYTSASAFPQIISYFDAMLKSHNNETVKDKSLESHTKDDTEKAKKDETIETKSNEKAEEENKDKKSEECGAENNEVTKDETNDKSNEKSNDESNDKSKNDKSNDKMEVDNE